MDHLGTCTVHLISTQTRQEGIKCTKGTEQLRSYCPNMHIGIYCESAAQSFHSLKTAAFGIKDKKSALLSPFFMTISLLKIIVAQEVHNGLKPLSECKVNSVQEPCAKCSYKVHILKFEILQIT